MNKISLIVTTINSYENLYRLFNSLRHQTLPKKYFEIIFIDQSVSNNLHNLIFTFSDLSINYLPHKIDTLSKIRNYGISNSKGNIIGFPDDDCWYYPETLLNVYNHFNSNTDCISLCGRIFDKNTNTNLVKKWPSKNTIVNSWNFYFLASATTLFTKNKLYFNEEIGPGTKYGSCEDVDYFFKLMKNKFFFYNINIIVMHPKMNAHELSEYKSLNYGLGFGYFFKNNFTPINFILYITSLIYLVYRIVKYLITFKIKYARVLIYSLFGRISPLFN
jgi:glycosyltransferase involved in cell wall biosynthesis